MDKRNVVKIRDNETKQIYTGVFSSETHFSISLRNVEGFGEKVLVFNKTHYSIV